MFRYKRIYVTILAALLLSTVICLSLEKRNVSIQKGFTEPIIPNQWSQIIAENIGGKIPSVTFNSETITPVTASPFMKDNAVMLPVDMLSERMHMLAMKIDAKTIRLQHGNRTALIDLDTDEVMINGETAVYAGASAEMNGMCYVSSDVVSIAASCSMDFNPGKLELSIVGNESGDSLLPSVFSLNEVNRMPVVGDQLDDGTCWAFASLSALESRLMPNETFSFSREQMALDKRFGFTNGSGAAQTALAYLLSWEGPIQDDSDVYGDGIINDQLSAVRHVQGAVFLKDPSAERLKETVYQYGAVEASMYLAMADSENLLYVDHYYNDQNHAYYYDGDFNVNHDVVVVGWDDTYSKDNFVKGYDLPGDGAFICMNSWGTSFGENGLFYVSYYDKAFASSCMYFSSVEPVTNYSHIYQTDICGVTANAGYGNDTAYFGNVYTPRSDELLSAVGFYTLGRDSTYEVYGVTDYENEASLQERELLASGVIDEQGYTTVRLTKSMELYAGEPFAVIVKICTPGCEYPVAVEKPTEQFPSIDISDGKGYISSNGYFFKSAERDSGSNICLKAYTIQR